MEIKRVDLDYFEEAETAQRVIRAYRGARRRSTTRQQVFPANKFTDS